MRALRSQPLRSASLAAFVFTAISAHPAEAQCAVTSDRFGNLGPNGQVLDLGVFDLGSGPRWIAAGQFTGIGSRRANFVAQWDGTQWAELGGGLEPDAVHGIGVVNRLLAFDDGGGSKLHISGRFEAPGIPGVLGVARWSGSAWEAVGSGAPSGLSSLTVFDDGLGPELYGIGGALVTSHSVYPYIWRLRAGTWSPLIGPHTGAFDSDGFLTSLAVYDDGSGSALYVGGQFTGLSGTGASCFNLACLRNGVWSPRSLGTWGDTVRTLRVHDDGSGFKLYVGGSLSSPAHSLTRWDGISFSPLPQGVLGAVSSLFAMPAVLGNPGGLWISGDTANPLHVWDGSALSVVSGVTLDSAATSIWAAATFDLGQGSETWIGGIFESVGGVQASNLARSTVSGWEATASGQGLRRAPSEYFQPLVTTMIEDLDGTVPQLVIGGSSLGAGGAQPLRGFGRWDGSGWSAMGDPNGTTSSLAKFDFGQGPEFVASGTFSVAGGPARVVHWNGSAWSALGSSTPSTVRSLAVFDDGSGARLYAGGSGLHRWNGSAWDSLGDTSSIMALHVHDDGSGPALFIGGFLVSLPGLPFHFGVARFDGSATTAVGPAIAANGDIRALATYDSPFGPRLIAGGHFSSLSGVEANGIASWNGSFWSSLGSGLRMDSSPTSSPGRVTALASFDDGAGTGAQLYAGGAFGVAGGLPARRLARWNGYAWSEVAGGLTNGQVDSLAVVHAPALGGPALAIGGSFGRLGAIGSNHIALIHGCDGVGELYCFGDGASAACPCGNESAPADRAGCRHSLGSGGVLRARGFASLTHDSLELDGSAMTPSSVLYFQGANRTAASPFGDGIKCTGGPYVRLGLKLNAGGASSYPGVGDATISTKALIAAPVTRHYQARYRNVASFCTPDTFNYTNAVAIAWQP